MTSQVLETFQEFLESLESPQPLQSLLVPFNNTKDIRFPSVQVLIQKEDGTFPEEPTEFEVPPYFTIQDILRLIWLHTKESDSFAPNGTFLGVPLQEGPPSTETTYQNATGLWFATDDSAINLPSPLQILQANIPLQQFTTDQGARQPVSFKPRERMTLEDAFLKETGSLPVFHAFSFLYTSRKYYRGETPISSRSWNGLFFPYFPRLSETNQTISEQERRSLQQTKAYILQKQREFKFIEDLLQSEEARPLEADKVRHLQLSFPKSVDFTGTDAFFYTTAVTPAFPFLRYLPSSGSPMTKLYRKTPMSLPEVHDCQLLGTWNELTVPPQSTEIVYGKVVLQQQKLYATLRVLEDGRADLTIQPPDGIRDLDFQRDLPIVEVLPALQSGLSTTLYDLDQAAFAQATIHLGYKADLGTRLTTTKKSSRKYEREITVPILRKRLARFSTVFQEIAPHEEDQAPSLMLRYKAVSNFDTEDRIGAYLTFQASKKLLQGTGLRDDVVDDVAMQFNLSQDAARERVAAWLAKRTETTVADPEAKEQQALYNPGTDIALILQHPNYTFHLYRVESLEDYWRIQSFLSLLFTLEDEFFEDEAAPSEKVVAATAAVEAESVPAVNAGEEVEVQGAVGDAEDYTFLDLGDGLDATGVEDLADEVPEEEAKPKSAPEPPKPVTKAVQAKEETGNEAENEVDTSKPRVAFNFYITRLQQLDKSLFDYKPKSPADSHWTTQCLASDTRQPLAMNQKEYSRMLRIYEDELTRPATDPGAIVFVEYGGDKLAEQLERAKSVVPKNRFYVMIYGSSKDVQNYYICAMYFCLKDYLVLIPDEFEDAGTFRGRRKEKEECPFCTGKKIPHKALKNPAPGQVVLAKKPAAGSDNKFHTFVRFLKDARHPERFELPCCFLKEPNEKEKARLVSLSTKKSAKRTNKPAAVNLPVAAAVEDEEDAEAEVVSTNKEGIEEVNYTYLATKLDQLYIQDYAKYPLQPGKVGQCNPALDAYFTQTSEDMTTREVIKQQLKPTGEGFLRVGVTTIASQTANSFFAALAPILGLHSSLEVATKLYRELQPRVFLALNFGNLVLEFYNIALQSPLRDPRLRNPTDGMLLEWAKRHLQLQVTSDNKMEIYRFFISFHRFRQYIADPEERKQYRHFVHLLNEPGVFTANGITLIVLEYKDASPASSSANIDVRCPAFGYDPERYAYTDTAFVTVDQQGLWEPILYAQRVRDPSLTRSAKQGKFVFGAQELVDYAPEIAKQRRSEFNKSCISAYRGIYSSQPFIDSRLLIPVQSLFRIFDSHIDKNDIIVRGVIRDTYNHLVAITVASLAEPTKPARERKEIVVPVADDGYLLYLKGNRDIQVYVSWPDSSTLANANEVYDFYQRIGQRVLSPMSKQYDFFKFLQKDSTVVGFQLGVPISKETPLLSLPCGPATSTVDGSMIQQVSPEFQFYWNRERPFLTIEKVYEEPDAGEYEGSEYIQTKQETEELYQQFRLSFANWIATGSDKADFRVRLQQIYTKRAPLVEKQKELDVLLGSIVSSWLAMDTEAFDVTPTFLRTDCLQLSLTDQSTCEGSGRCKWMSEAEGEPRCRLHVHQDVPIRRTRKGIETMKADLLFRMRLYDELLRLPAERFALLNKGVKQIQAPTRDIQIGDQYILPDSVPAYEELFQTICKSAAAKGEEPKYYEEYSTQDQPVSETYTTLAKLRPLPPLLSEKLPEEARTTLALQLVASPGATPTQSLLLALAKAPFTPSLPDRFDDYELTKLSLALEVPIVQVSLSTGFSSVGIAGLQVQRDPVRILVPDSPEGPAIVIVRDSRSQVIPIAYLEGPIEEAVKTAIPKRKRVKVLLPPPNEA